MSNSSPISMPHVSVPIPSGSSRASSMTGALEFGCRAAPIAIAGFLNMAVSMTDTAMMAWLDPDALAGGAIVSDAYSIAFYFASGVLAAVTPLAARANGAGATHQVGQIVACACAPLVLLSGGGFFLVRASVDILVWTGIEVPDRSGSTAYARYMATAFGFMLIFSLGRSTLAAIGRGRMPMLILLAAVPVNAIANYAFMYGRLGAPEMGLAGAGVASLLIAIFAAAATATYVISAPSMRRYRFGSGFCQIRLAEIAGLTRLGTFLGVTAIGETGAFMASTLLVGAVAADAFLAHTVALRILGLGYCIATALGQTVTAWTATARGAADRHQEMLVLRAAIGICLFTAACALTAGLFGAGHPVFGMDSSTFRLLPYAGVVIAASTVNNIAVGLLRARRIAAVPATLGLLANWVVPSTIVTVAVGVLPGENAVWVALSAGATISAFAASGYAGCILARELRQASAMTSPARCSATVLDAPAFQGAANPIP